MVYSTGGFDICHNMNTPVTRAEHEENNKRMNERITTLDLKIELLCRKFDETAHSSKNHLSTTGIGGISFDHLSVQPNKTEPRTALNQIQPVDEEGEYLKI